MRAHVPCSLAIAAVFAVLATRSSPPARGCAMILPRGGSAEVVAETAVIVWDAANKTEHFIRSANFRTTSADFGFLVPTPTQPELGEADELMFSELAMITAPRVEHRTEIVWTDPPGGGCLGANAGATFANVGSAVGPKSAAPPVQVLEEKQVGDFKAAVLKAEDAGKLREWLAANGYDARESLTEWLKWYVEHKWFITAFKVSAPPEAGGQAQARAVRLSFPADRPFYPYREPAAERAPPGTAPPRVLRVFVLADGRYAGTLGDGKQPWPGRTVWANKLSTLQVSNAVVAGKLPPAVAGREWYLTEYEDPSSPRPGIDEVYFAPAADQTAVERPPLVIVNYEYRERPRSWPVVAVAGVAATPVLVLIAGLVGWRVLRRGAGTPGPDAV